MDFIAHIIHTHLALAPLVIYFLLIAAGFGIPISEEGVIILTSLVVLKNPQAFWPLYLTLLVGVYCADLISFFLGRHFGPKLLSSPRFKKYLPLKRYQKLCHFYERYGVVTLMVGRFIPFGVRTALFLTAGLSRFSVKKFIFADAISSFLSTTTYFCLVYFFGHSILERFQLFSKNIFLALLVVFVIARLLRSPKAGKFKNLLMRRLFIRRHQLTLYRQHRALQTQEKLWKKTKKNLRGTQIYQDLGLEQIHSYQDYVKKIASKDYSFYTPYVEKIEQGVKKVLFNDALDSMALTSGTTGFNNKKVPLNKGMIQIFDRFNFQAGGFVYTRNPQFNILSDQRFVYSAPPFTEIKNGVHYGYLSGIMAQKKQKISERNVFPAKKVLAITNWEEQLDAIALDCFNQDIRVVQGIPCYIYNVFKKLLEKTGKTQIKEIWPNLHTLIYIATPIEHLRQSFAEIVGRELDFFGIYSATEAPLGMEAKTENGKSYYAPFLDSILFAFVPVEQPQLSLTIDEVEVGETYYLNTGTPNGLLRYALNDCVKIVQTKPALLFEIIGRKDGAINIAAEKVSQSSVLSTISALTYEMDLAIDHFFLYPVHPLDDRPYYQWALCLPHAINRSQAEIAHFLDRKLMEISEDYKERRVVDGVIAPAQVDLLPLTFSTEYFQKFRKNGQFKMKMIFEGKEQFEVFFRQTVRPILVQEMRG